MSARKGNFIELFNCIMPQELNLEIFEHLIHNRINCTDDCITCWHMIHIFRETVPSPDTIVSIIESFYWIFALRVTSKSIARACQSFFGEELRIFFESVRRIPEMRWYYPHTELKWTILDGHKSISIEKIPMM